MHNAALADMGLDDWRYQLLPVPPELFDETVHGLPAAGFVGASVTIPHKEAALSIAASASATATGIGAANTLLFGADGTISAENTDAPGLISALPEPPAVGATAQVLGAGGSARAAIWALSEAGVDVKVWNRTPGRALSLAGELGAEAVERPSAADILVNCTVAGMEDDPFDILPLGPGQLGEYPTVVDFVYADRSARLLDAARAAGCATVDGITILVRQGALALEMWTGRPAPVAVMDAAARAALTGDA